MSNLKSQCASSINYLYIIKVMKFIMVRMRGETPTSSKRICYELNYPSLTITTHVKFYNIDHWHMRP